MKTGAAEQWLRQQLRTVYDEREATNIAAMAMERITGANRLERIKKQDEPLDVYQLHHLTEIEQRLLRHEPVQYVLGEAWFYNLKLYVDKHVLIPRPETEELVHWIINDIKAKGLNVFERGATEADVTTQLKILDIGTGSGCIALALKHQMPKAEVWGCDVSEEALNVARRNGSELDIRVDFQGVDILDEAQQRLLPTVDIIVSNPPYIPLKDKETMHANVLEHEPHLALFVPDNDALKFYKAIAHFAKKRLYENGALYFEIHEDLGDSVVALFESEGYQTELRKDMQGKYRMVKAAHAPAPKGEG
jgi:release factor glutamine methyltransferase